MYLGYHLGRIYEVFEFEEHKEILSFCQYALVDNQVVESTFLKVVSVKENRILDESSLLVVTNQFDFNLQCPSIRNDCVLVTEVFNMVQINKRIHLNAFFIKIFK